MRKKKVEKRIAQNVASVLSKVLAKKEKLWGIN